MTTPLVASRRLGVVQAIVAGPPPRLTITLGGDEDPEHVVDAAFLQSYAPTVGDVVHVLANQGVPLVLGTNGILSGGTLARCHVRNTSNITTLSNGVWAAIFFDTEDYDSTGTMHSQSLGVQDQVVIPQDGTWQVCGGLGLNASASMTRMGARLTKNGTVIPGSGQLLSPGITTGSGGAINTRTIIQPFVEGDLIRLEGFFTGPATSNVNVTAELQSTLTVMQIL